MKIKLFGLAAAFTFCLSAGPAAQAAGKLNIYNWFDYLPQELIDKFAREHDVEVTMDTYDSNESLLARLKAGGHRLRRGGSRGLHGGDPDQGGNAGEGSAEQDGELQAHEEGVDRRLLGPRAANTPSRTSGAPPTSWSTPRCTTGTSTPLRFLFDPPAEVRGKNQHAQGRERRPQRGGCAISATRAATTIRSSSRS